MRAPHNHVTRLDFPGLPHRVELQGACQVRSALATVMPDWKISESRDRAPSDTPLTTVMRDADAEYSFQSRWANAPLTGLGIAGATCGVVADLIQAHLDARPGLFGLHAGAVRMGGHLVAMTGAYRAGKTTLVTRLGLEPGCELFCDDILPVAPDGMAVAMGVQPRLRLPLPESLATEFAGHVTRNLTVHDHRYGFVSMPGQAPRGTRARLDALVVLSREEGAAARFHRLDPGDAAAFLIRQNIADPGDMEAHYDHIADMTERLVCLTLVYSDLEEAAGLIRRTFDAPQIPALDDAPGAALDHVDPDEAVDPTDLSLVLARADEVIARVIGADTFLWQMEDRNFFRLNPVGGAVWMLLEDPASGHDIVAALHEVFPDVPVQTIARDVARLLGQMKWRGLVNCLGYGSSTGAG